LTRAPVPGLSAPEFFTWRRTTSVFEASAAYRIGGAMTLGRDGQLQQVNAARVSADFFALFGARAARGRTFTLEEDRPGGPALAVVTDEFWRLRMHAAADALGQRLSLDGQDYDVIGVLEPDFDADALGLSRSPRPDVWVPLQLDPASTSDAPLLAVARLRGDASIDVARVQTEAAGAAVRRVLPQVMPEEAGLTVEPLHDVVVRDVRPALLLLLGAVALVLLIVCVNTAHLLLVRAASRQREMAIRLATGASRLRIVRQLLTESLLLSMAGGALGVYLAIGGLRALVAGYADALAPTVADNTDTLMDGRVLAFALLTSIVAGVLFGLAPALQSVRVDLEAVCEAAANDRGSTSRRRIGGLFVVSEMALALMLLIGSAFLSAVSSPCERSIRLTDGTS
jgi:predicted permease